MSGNSTDLESLAKSATDDFYVLLGVAQDATPAEISKAYRQASIRYHPDKNPDNKDAAERFIYLGWARDILKDDKLRGEYDRARDRRREKALQEDRLSGERRKMIQDLERREREHSNRKRKRAEEMDEGERKQHQIEMEIAELSALGKRQVKELNERRARERKEAEASFMNTKKCPEPQTPTPDESPDMDRTIKVQFKREGETKDWGEEKISSMFAKYGEVDIVIMRKDKVRHPGKENSKTIATVFVTYTRLDYADAAVRNATSDYPSLKSTAWVITPSARPTVKPPPTFEELGRKIREAELKQGGKPKGPQEFSSFGTPKFSSFKPRTLGSEKTTMMKSRQAEKQRLEEEIRKQDAAEDAAAKERAEETAV